MDALDHHDAPSDVAALAERVWRRADRAVERGRLREAQGWTKLWRELCAVAAAQAKARVEQVSAARRAAVDEACRRVRDLADGVRSAATAARPGAPAPAAELHSLHSLHSVHPVSETAARRPPLSRAERRRRDRLAAVEARKAARLGAGLARDGPGLAPI